MHRGRLIAAIIVSAALVLLAPFFGEVRRTLRAAFPGQFVLILGVAAGLLLAAAVLAALLRIRDRRAIRYVAIGASLTAAAGYSFWAAGPDPQVNAVERFHLLQYGLITFLFYRAWRPLEDASIVVLPVVAGLLVGTVEEWFQWFIPARVGEMRDVFLNGVAIACGVLFSLGVDPPRMVPLHLSPGSARRIARFAAAVVLVFAAFVHSVHLGHLVVHPEAGSFHSRYDGSQLEALAADRETTWKLAPPLQRPARVSREDQYMSEGLLHVQERNRRWEAGDVDGAWRENLILERFYAPVLDTPSYVAPTGHRWPAEQRADAEARRLFQRGEAGGAPASTHVSRADGGFIRVWPPVPYWLAMTGAAAVILLIGSWFEHRAHGPGAAGSPTTETINSSRASRTAHPRAER